MHRKETLNHIIFLIVIALGSFFLVFHDGFPIGHDYKNHMVGFSAVLEQFKNGEIYPRWLFNINYGFGGANLYFYPPAIYYVGYLIDRITFHSLETSQIISLVIFLFLISSGFTSYIWLRSYCSKKASVIAAALYMCAPYHLWIDIYERNSTAEFAAFALTPLLFLFTKSKLWEKRAPFAGLTLCYALLVMTHLPSAIFIPLFLTLYKMLIVFSSNHNPAFEKSAIKESFIEMLTFFSAIFLGLSIACVYFYPALNLLDTVRSHIFWNNIFYDYKIWFLWPKNQCPGSGEYCSLLFLIALTQFLLPAFFSLLLWDRLSGKIKHQTAFFLIISTVCFFMMIPAARFVWDILIPLQKIQFPYRLLMLSDFFFISLTAALLSIPAPEKQIRRNATIISLCLIYTALIFHTVSYVQQSWRPDKSFFDDRIAKRISNGEYFPRNKEMTASLPDFVQIAPQPPWRLISGNAKLYDHEKHIRTFTYKVDAQENSVIYIRQFFFPAWEAYIKNQNGNKKTITLSAAEPYGQISIEIPKGQYSLTLAIKTLPEEKIGQFISFAGLILLGLLLVRWTLVRKKRSQEKKAPAT